MERDEEQEDGWTVFKNRAPKNPEPGCRFRVLSGKTFVLSPDLYEALGDPDAVVVYVSLQNRNLRLVTAGASYPDAIRLTKYNARGEMKFESVHLGRLLGFSPRDTRTWGEVDLVIQAGYDVVIQDAYKIDTNPFNER